MTAPIASARPAPFTPRLRGFRLLAGVVLASLSLSGPVSGEAPRHLVGPGPRGPTTEPQADDLSIWVQGLRDLAPDASRGATVSDLTLTRDVGVFRMNGQLHALNSIDGRTIGVVFTGQGRFEMSAPDPLEERQLVRHYGSTTIDADFRAGVFLFTDLTLSEIEQQVTWAPLEPSREAVREAEEAREYFTNGDGWVSRKLLLPLANAGPGFFYAHVSEDRGAPFIFSVDPFQAEEVTLSGKQDRTKRPETRVQFHRMSDYESGRSIPQEGLDLLSVSSIDVETTIDDDLDLVGRATLDLERRLTNYAWVPFSLFFELRVDSLRWSDGSPAPFYRPRDSSDLWVDVSSAPAVATELTFHYSGDMMDRPRDLWVQLGSHQTWRPVYEFDRLIPHTLTFHAPEDLVVTTVGTQTSTRTVDEVTTTTWETGPVRMVTFNIGAFDRLESGPVREGDPNLTVLVNERAHRVLSAMVNDAGGLLLGQRDMGEMVAIDLRSSFGFFNEVYGPTTVQDFVATEIPYSHGEAYPGLVMLAWNTFQWTSTEGYDEMFRAHEVAHQWWGIGVRPATYRDWWIAEGFSEFSGWWYAARATGSVDKYHSRLEETREEILDRRGESAPIALGQRAGSSEHPEDYVQTIYNKSAWVLHMLRILLTDPDTGNDDSFTRVMNEFYTRHLGGTATTASFQAVVEEVVGGNMDWFFQQWVYGSDVPTYTFSHTYTEQPDGQIVATVRVRQEDVPEDFQMIVPVHLDFGDDGSATVRVLVSGAETVMDLPLLPREPDEIEFNPFESVLAETKTEGWRGR